MGLHQTKKFLHSKEITNKMKDSLLNGKTFANDTSDKGLYEIHEEFIQFNTKINQTILFKMGRGLE